jgi:uncharacterized membrane protein YbhN (UPF0104 family)
MKSVWRPLASLAVLAVTAAVFVTYFREHPEVHQQLGYASPGGLALLLGLYLLVVASLALITMATLRLCKLRLGKSESLLLTAYTAVINFFGPLQSGPALRAVYLKQKHGLKLKNYAAATLVYYFFFGLFSVVMLLSGWLGWWLVVPAIVLVIGWRQLRRDQRLTGRLSELDLRGWYLLALATLLQVVLTTVIYYVELRSVAPGTSLQQAVIYTGAANLALFVSLTPGAIGFRESFLLFSQQLHHVATPAIVAASLLDRAVYVVLLLGLAVFIFATHARRRLGVAKT